MEQAGLTIERRGAPLAMHVRGELDVSTVGTLEVVLVAEMEASPGGVDVDLSGLEFMGFAAVEMLTRLAHRGASTGRPLRVVATNRIVDRVVDIASGQHTLDPVTRERVTLLRPCDVGTVGSGRFAADTGPPALSGA